MDHKVGQDPLLLIVGYYILYCRKRSIPNAPVNRLPMGDAWQGKGFKRVVLALESKRIF